MTEQHAAVRTFGPISTTGPVTGGNGQATSATPALVAGYEEHEYFFGGEALSYELIGARETDGHWSARESATAAFRSRLIVRRPRDVSAFSGVVFFEWLNVTAGADGAPDWGFGNEEFTREGHAWVGVSAQRVGVSGGDGVLAEAASLGGGQGGLVGTDPARYGSLVHPGDAFSFDIFNHAAAAVRQSDGPRPLGDLQPRLLIATGESQSATFMATYVNAVHPLTGLFDGFMLHSRLGSAPDVDGGWRGAEGPDADDPTSGPPTRIRTDGDVPVMQFVSETDLTVLRFAPARQSDSDMVVTWEVAGTAHADRYLMSQLVVGLDIDPGQLLGCSEPLNDGSHHETFKAAIHHLVAWADGGARPPSGPVIETRNGESAVAPPVIVRDALGNAIGGIRTPSVDVPIAALSGEPAPGCSQLCTLFGTTRAFDEATLARLYPTHDDYVRAFATSLADTVEGGYVLATEAATMLANAEASNVGR